MGSASASNRLWFDYESKRQPLRHIPLLLSYRWKKPSLASLLPQPLQSLVKEVSEKLKPIKKDNRKMEQNKDKSQIRSVGSYIQPRAYLSKDGEYLTLVLPGNMVVRKHVNYFKAILGVEFNPKVNAKSVA